MNFNNPEDTLSSSGMSGSSDVDETESEEEASDDETGTAMSLDMGENTAQSLGGSDSSTSSSARLEANLRMAAQQAGTRGIEYDEFGDASMELAGEEVTNAFKPFAGQQPKDQPVGSASMDQENVNPFSPAFKAQLVSGSFSRPSTVQEEDTGDLSMDMTKSVGGMIQQPVEDNTVSSSGDGTMDMTQAVGQIKMQGQKRRRSTTDAGSPGAAAPTAQSKRRRSSTARSSMGDDTMDLTMAIGGIKEGTSPAKPQRRRVSTRRRSSGGTSVASEQDDTTMDLTRAVGGVKFAEQTNNTSSSYDENEELSMDLTAVLGGVKAADKPRPTTPRNSQSPLKEKANTTPKDQERFKDAPDSGARKLLTQMFQKQVQRSAEKQASASRSRDVASPAARGGPIGQVAEETERVDEQIDSAKELATKVTPKGSPVKIAPASGKRASLGDHRSPLRATPNQGSAKARTHNTPDSGAKRMLDAQLETAEPSPIVAKQLRSSPMKQTPATPEQVQDEPTQDGRRLAESIKLMSTPRKDALKNVTPKKQTPAVKQASPAAAPPSRLRPTPKNKTQTQPQSSPAKQLVEDVSKIKSSDRAVEKVKLQEFLDLANIRFMDLTATKRRMTTAITPSKARKAGQMPEDPEVNFESAIVAGGCTLPELEMYEHACHELKRYISDGKKVIKELESSTSRDTPPLIQAYMAANHGRRSVLDTQMRDIKTQARLRSKEMWYAWRSQLLEDLMKALQGIGEGLISDDEALTRAEQILYQALPGLAEKRDALQQQAEILEQEAVATNDEEKEELDAARERIQDVSAEQDERRSLLQDLQRQAKEQDETATDIEEQKAEFIAAIKEAERVKDACRGVSISEIASLKGRTIRSAAPETVLTFATESIASLEEQYGWSITSASSSPPTVTMTYRNQLQIFFHPAAFLQPDQQNLDRPNAPIGLIYTLTKPLGTTLRFFLQLLRASLQALPQSSTRVSDLLHLVSNGWETAQSVAEAERRLNIEGMTEARIISDESLSISSLLLLPQARTKVRVTLDVSAAVGAGDEDGLELSTTVSSAVKVVYGESYNEKKMSDFVAKEIGDGFEGWDGVVRDLRERLIARGSKSGGSK